MIYQQPTFHLNRPSSQGSGLSVSNFKGLPSAHTGSSGAEYDLVAAEGSRLDPTQPQAAWAHSKEPDVCVSYCPGGWVFKMNVQVTKVPSVLDEDPSPMWPNAFLLNPF